MTGWQREAPTAAMSSTRLTWERPPQRIRSPGCVPLARLQGATPARAEIAFPLSSPNSGSSASSVARVTGPTPGILLSRASFALQTRLALRVCVRALSRRLKRTGSNAQGGIGLPCCQPAGEGTLA